MNREVVSEEGLAEIIAEHFARLERRIDSMEEKLDRQAEAIEKMHDVFDRIMVDYFDNVVQVIGELSRGMAEGKFTPEELAERFEIFSETLDMLSPDTAQYTSDDLRKIYDELSALKEAVARIEEEGVDKDTLWKYLHTSDEYVMKRMEEHKDKIVQYVDAVGRGTVKHTEDLGTLMLQIERRLKQALNENGKYLSQEMSSLRPAQRGNWPKY